MKAPTKYHLSDLCGYVNMNDTQCETPDGKWVPARPEGYYSIIQRIKCAYLAFTGKADVVVWPNNQ